MIMKGFRNKMTHVSFVLFFQTVEDLEERVKAAGIEVAVRQNFLTDPTNAVRNLKVLSVLRTFPAVRWKNQSRRFLQAMP